MRQVSLDQELQLLERRISRQIADAVAPIDTRVSTLESPAVTASDFNAPPNYLPNSHPEYSYLAYSTAGTAASTVSDDNRRCYQWFQNTFFEVTDLVTTSGSPTVTSASNPFTAARFSGTMQFIIFAGDSSGATLSGTITRVGDGTATLSVNAGATLTGATMYFGRELDSTATATYLLGSGHSGYAGLSSDAPVWDVVNGNFNLGSVSNNYTISMPLPTDFVYPGQTYYVTFEASVAASDTDIGSSQQFFCGFWDQTLTRRRWIEGGSFTPTASVYGVAGSRTLNYKILAKTDSGTEMLSTEITVTTAPSTLTEQNHVRLSFSGAPGFIYYGIYRKDGTTYRKVHEIRNSIDLQFFDMQETVGSVESGYPTITTATPKAYAVTQEFEPGDLSSTAFALHTATIKVPSTYNRSNTTNAQQWFRFGLTDLVPSGNAREVVIRRISVSEGYGTWARSPRDMTAASSPTSTATSAPSSGNPTTEPPDGGSGGPFCSVLDTLTDKICPQTHVISEVPISEVNKDDWILHGGIAVRVKDTIEGVVQETIEIVTENGFRWEGSKSHRFRRSHFDRSGKAVRLLKEGDVISTKLGLSPIISKRTNIGEKRVKGLMLPKPHLYWTNGIESHNLKLD